MSPLLHPSPRHYSPSKSVTLCILASHNRGSIIILWVGQKERVRLFANHYCPWWTVFLHSKRKGFFFPLSFFFTCAFLPTLSLCRELCRLLLMCFWQLNLINGLLVKETTDCTHGKNMLSLFCFFFRSLPCSSKLKLHNLSMTQFQEGRKQRKVTQNYEKRRRVKKR